MLKINDLYGRKVYVPKKAKKKKGADPSEVKLSKLGKVHMAVFSPNGREVVGFLVTRPDIAGMVKRPDVFLAWDSFRVLDDGGLCVSREDDGMDDAARKRLGGDWDSCVMWAGMDAQTVGGKKLGYVSDAEYNTKTGKVARFFVGDGGMARALVGSFEIPASMVRGYSKGRMIVDDAAADIELNGGVAAKVGEGYAKAKVKGAEAAHKAGKAAGEAVDKGSYAFGRMLGRAKRAIEDATAEDEPKAKKDAEPERPTVPAADVRVSAPEGKLRAGAEERASRPEPTTYAPVEDDAKKNKSAAGQKVPSADGAGSGPKRPSAKPSSKQTAKSTAKPAAKKPSSEQAARAVGKQIGRMGKMFSSFKDEFDKASK